MDERTFTALQGSIEKWEKIVAGVGQDHGGLNCPLCREFAGGPLHCKGCPVRDKTGIAGCEGTPYYAYKAAEVREPKRADLYAQEMLDFLKDLLPKTET